MPEALTLFVFTMLLLFLPRIVSVVVALGRPEEVAKFGGRARLICSAVLESAVSALLAPINMMFNTKFVVYTLLGQGVSWVGAEAPGGRGRHRLARGDPHPRAAHGLRPGVGRLLLHPGPGLLLVAEPGPGGTRVLDSDLDLPQQGGRRPRPPASSASSSPPRRRARRRS